ncbi:MAG: PKD domain-containing protein, partial [Dehalococcoidales bacterium]|nr:PKD domain-containing protein [Dehalococcoidales bacterium]
DFNASKTTVKEGENIFFSADIAGGFAPYSYQWDLGDKTTSTESGVVHAYNNGGKYTVTLTVTDDHGTKINKTRTDYISVIPGWSAGDIATGARNGLVTFSHVIVSILIWLGFFSPVWIIVGVILYLLWRRRKKTQ